MRQSKGKKRTGQPWRHTASAPEDNTRVLVTSRPLEEGPAQSELIYWTDGEPLGTDGW
ncbi:conserved hypothetical protein [Agrobacterium tumefaciens str. CFBP 5621]|nr:conserved hypothetical protein [Agrobacterium tumefaciens str. CFBP 5621]